MTGAGIHLRIRVTKEAWIGPGKISLLEAMHRTGSISQAARDLNMSYRRAWLLVDSINAAFAERVTQAKTGGRRGGGITVTPFGLRLITAYRSLEQEVAERAVARLRGIYSSHRSFAARPNNPSKS